jgi:putative transposase
MTEDKNPYDNAIAERTNGILKNKFGLDEIFDIEIHTNKQVRQLIEVTTTKGHT